MPPGQSFEMTQEKPVLLILKLRRANNFVINVIVYSEYDSEIEMMNNRKVICHEYALKKHAKTISLAHYHQGVSSSKNEMNMPPFATQIKKKILKFKSSTLIW